MLKEVHLIAVTSFIVSCNGGELLRTDFDPNPQYSYAYSVNDALTGDSKGQIETRNGDVVRGSYSLIDPDGIRRTVEYTADPVNGFNAIVYREPAIVGAHITAYPAVFAPPLPVPVAVPPAPTVPVNIPAASPVEVVSSTDAVVVEAPVARTTRYIPPPEADITTPILRRSAPASVPVDPVSVVGYTAATAAVATPVFRTDPLVSSPAVASVPAKSFWMSFSTPHYSYSY